MDRFARVAVALACLASALSVAPAAADDAPIPTPRSVAPAADPGTEIVFRALSLLGVHYRFGGNTPESGLDCSGLVRLVFHDTLGLPLPRRSEEISRVGGSVRPTELQPGDLVFFNTLRRAFSHVGIYIGNNQFVHAPSSGGQIRVESLGADYWSRRFDGARRVITADLLAAGSFSSLATGAVRPAPPLSSGILASVATPALPTTEPIAAPTPQTVSRPDARRAGPPTRSVSRPTSRPPASNDRVARRDAPSPRTAVVASIYVN
jgi:hypothetical protein